MLQRLLYVFLILLSPMLVMAQQDSVHKHYDIDNVVVTIRQKAVSLPDEHGNVTLNMEALKDAPRIGGAVDALKLLQYTPGVTATEEGSAAMFVRGGDVGQCLTLLNDAPIYSPSHLLGIFSVFNSAHLSGLTLYKSGIPTRYGSSTASILDVRTHRYIPERMHLTANVGLIESDAALQLPMGEKFALFASARHSYVSWFTSLLSSQKSDLGYSFGDYGLGFVADVGKVGKLIMNTHFNHDTTYAEIFMYNGNGKLKWWNGAATLTLETPLRNEISLKNTIYSSLYNNKLTLTMPSLSFDIFANVQDMGVKSMASITLDRVDIDTGIDYALRRIRPQSVSTTEISSSHHLPFSYSHEAALFASALWRIHQHLEVDGGLRLSLYSNEYQWCYPEPRVMVSIPISTSLRLWGGYNMMVQYIHLVPQSNMSFATDFYVGASKHTPPQLSHNFSLGYAQSAFNGALHWSAEVYYRYMLNAIEYNSNILNLINGYSGDINELHCGRGEAYGLETSIGYCDNSFDIHLNYTLAKSIREFPTINEGKAFAASSDRRHNLSVIASYKPSPQWTLSASFVYASGAPYTAVKSLYISGNTILKEVGMYNGARLPELHHLDLSVTYWFKCRRVASSGINLSIYNVYAHENPIMLSWAIEVDDNGVIEFGERYHTIYTILPSISWTVKF